MSKEHRIRLWIATNLIPIVSICPHDSYDWSRVVGRSIGNYVSNNEFKTAMAALGYAPYMPNLYPRYRVRQLGRFGLVVSGQSDDEALEALMRRCANWIHYYARPKKRHLALKDKRKFLTMYVKSIPHLGIREYIVVMLNQLAL